MAQNNSNGNSSNSSIEKKRSLTPEANSEVRVLGIAEYEQAAQCMFTFPHLTSPLPHRFPPKPP